VTIQPAAQNETSAESAFGVTSNFKAYLPRLLLKRVAQSTRAPSKNFIFELDAVTLFADIDGFTAMGDALSVHHRIGTEELTEILNRHFASLIQIVHHYGGDVIRFGGDAISVLFEHTERNRKTAARRALACALALQKSVASRKPIETSVGAFRLSMKCGLAMGRVRVVVVEDKSTRLDYVCIGDAMLRSIQAERHAQSGEIVASNELAALLSQVSRWSKNNDGFAALETFSNYRSAFHAFPKKSSPQHEAVACRFLHPYFVERKDATSEHRDIVALFARMIGSKRDRFSNLQAFERLMNVVVDHGGLLARIDVDDEAVRLMIVFGAPFAHEDDLQRALRCALDLRNCLPSIRIGINSGVAFCAHVGSDERREYTVMGDCVNVAARLSKTARGGQIVVGANVLRKTQNAFRFTKLNSAIVKGKRERIDRFDLKGGKTLRNKHTAIIGRKVERNKIQNAMRRIMNNESLVVIIEGEAGIGKTTLAQFALAKAQSFGFVTRTLMHEDWLRVDQNLRPETYESKQRDEWTRASLLKQLKQDTSDRPLLWVIENAHEMSDTSRETLEFLFHSSPPRVMWLLTQRPTGAKAQRNFNVTRVKLKPLDEKAARSFAQTLWEKRLGAKTNFPAKLLRDVVKRAAGNPLFVESIVNDLCDQTEASKKAPAAITRFASDLHRLVLSRFDRFDTSEQAVLRAASVVGIGFDNETVEACFDNQNDLAPTFDSLARRGLIEHIDTARWRFKNELTQEAIYECISLETRAALHKRIGNYLESTRAQNDDVLDALAFHFSRCAEVAKQRIYLARAGEVALKSNRHSTAMHHYEQLLRVTPRNEQAPGLIGLGRAAHFLGNWKRAAECFQVALSIAETVEDQLLQAECCLALGELFRQSRTEGLDWLLRARDIYLRLHDLVGASRALHHATFVLVQLGQLEVAKEFASLHQQIAHDANDEFGRADALHNLGQIALFQGHYREAKVFFASALKLAKRIGHSIRVIHVANDIARMHWQLGDYEQALRELTRAINECVEIGYQSMLSLFLGNVGAIYWHVGMFQVSKAFYARALSINIEIGDQPNIALQLGNLAQVCMDMNEIKTAFRVAKLALQLSQRLGIPYYQCDHFRILSQLFASKRRWQKAFEYNHRAIAFAKEAHDEEMLWRTRLFDVELKWKSGVALEDKAIAQLESMRNEATSDEERASVDLLIWRMNHSRTVAKKSATAEYAKLYQKSSSFEYRKNLKTLKTRRLPPRKRLTNFQLPNLDKPVDLEAEIMKLER
jgi:class 3 adenylate cyclase/tetratricopeptide (TPR) repeat protein